MGGTLLGGTQPGYPLSGYPPGQDRGTLPGGTQVGYPPGRVPPSGPGQDGGGTQLGQQKEYSLHGGQYASCVHAGGLSCLFVVMHFSITVEDAGISFGIISVSVVYVVLAFYKKK